MGLLTKIQSRLELRRLEKKYTTRRKVTPPSHQTAQYIDGEYIYEDPNPSLPPSSFFHPQQNRNSHPTSSSSIYAEQQQRQQHPPISPTAISFTTTFSPEPAPASSSLYPHITASTANSSSTASSTTNHTSLTSRHSQSHSLSPSLLSPNRSSARNSSMSTSATEGGADLSRMLSRNSRGQSWQPPKVGWGSDGTDAWKCELESGTGGKREFRFDVEGDRRSMIVENRGGEGFGD